jgi:hypothetical protein
MIARIRNPNRKPTHPGAILREDVLPALGMTQTEFAPAGGVPFDRFRIAARKARPVRRSGDPPGQADRNDAGKLAANARGFGPVGADQGQGRRICSDRAAGGYDQGGAYWGHGAPLFWACDESTHSAPVEMFLRAADREAVKAKIRESYPAARFYR